MIPVGTADCPGRTKYTRPDAVKTPADLPERYYLGDLDPDTFTKDESGWRGATAKPLGEAGLSL